MYSVLIADDEDIIRRGFIEFVPWNELGFEVVYDCENGMQAVDYLKKHDVDFVLTDIVMVGITGLDIAKYIYENKPNTVICLVSGHRDFEYARQAMKYNVTNYLTKPTDVSELIEMVKEVKLELDKTTQVNNVSSSDYERFLLDISIGKYPTVTEAENAALDLGINPDRMLISPVWISIDNFDDFISTKWHHGKELLFTAVLNFLRDTVTDKIIFNIIINTSDGLYIIANLNSSELDENDLHTELRNAAVRIQDEMGLKIIYSFDSEFTSLGEYMKFISDKSNLVSDKFAAKILVNKVKDYIAKHFSDNISLEDAAKTVYLNPSYLSRIFKQYTGENFKDYIIKYRINKAIELINKKQYKIYEISEMCGYSNPKYFTQQFKQIMGISPSEYAERKE